MPEKPSQMNMQINKTDYLLDNVNGCSDASISDDIIMLRIQGLSREEMKIKLGIMLMTKGC